MFNRNLAVQDSGLFSENYLEFCCDMQYCRGGGGVAMSEKPQKVF